MSLFLLKATPICLVIFVIVIVSPVTSMPDVCEQLRTGTNIDIIALGIGDHSRIILLANNFYGYQVDLSSLVYPPESGYPSFFTPRNDSRWALELNSNCLFDALAPHERTRTMATDLTSSTSDATSHFIIHNQTIANSFVTIFPGDLMKADLKGSLVKRFSMSEAKLDSVNVVSFRRLPPAEPEVHYFYTNHQLPPVCVSTTLPSIGYSVLLTSDQKDLCFTEVELRDGAFGKLGNAKRPDYELKVTTTSNNDSSLCAAPNTTQCGLVLNSVLFAVDNKQRMVYMYQNPFNGNHTNFEPMHRASFADFFVCTYGLGLWWYLAIGSAIIVVTLIAGLVALKVAGNFRWKKKCRKRRRQIHVPKSGTTLASKSYKMDQPKSSSEKTLKGQKVASNGTNSTSSSSTSKWVVSSSGSVRSNKTNQKIVKQSASLKMDSTLTPAKRST